MRISSLFFAAMLMLFGCHQNEDLLTPLPQTDPALIEDNSLTSARLSATAIENLSSYDRSVLSDGPVAFWNTANANDASNNEYNGTTVNSPTSVGLPNGDRSLVFNGTTQYVEFASVPDFSVPTTGVLTIEAWIRPDILTFPVMEGSGYVHWMGKGATQEHEYAARMYGENPTGGDAGRVNRISGYAFNASGNLGAGSYYQASNDNLIRRGEWIHYMLVINTKSTSAQYPTGYTKLYVHRTASDGTISTFTDQDALKDYDIIPQAGSAPFRIGTRDLRSFFKGAIGKVAIYNYELSSARSLDHVKKMYDYDSFILSDGPVAYWNNSTGKDLTRRGNTGTKVNAPTSSGLPNSDRALVFNGIDQYLEVASSPDLSASTSGILTIEAWIRPDALRSAVMEGTTSTYIHWMGKGVSQSYEYASRLNISSTEPWRITRITGYAFNLAGGSGVGSIYQPSTEWPIQTGEWMYYVYVINTKNKSAQYPAGYVKQVVIRKDSNGNIVKFEDQDNLGDVTPAAGTAPFRLGTRDLRSFFQGAVGKVAVYDYEISSPRAEQHYIKMFN